MYNKFNDDELIYMVKEENDFSLINVSITSSK